MAKLVVALIERREEADALVDELIARCGCDRDDIGVLRRGSEHGIESPIGGDTVSGAAKGAGAGAALGGAAGLLAGVASVAIPGFGPVIAAGPLASALTGAGLGAVTGGVIGALTKAGVPEDDARYYEDGLRRGGTLLSVDAPNEGTAQCAAGVLEGERAEAAEDATIVPVIREELVVGKREVERGGVRIHTRVIETPVEERVALREERAQVDRQPVDRPARADVFKEEVIEIRETAEEPVITKRARVVEEVVISTQVTQREETVHDTVRRTDVRIERDGASSASPYTGAERRVRQRRVAAQLRDGAKNAPGTMEGSPGAAGGR